MLGLKTLALALLALVLLVLALAAWGAWRWQASTRALIARLEAARAPPAPARYHSARELPGLPAPVQRFFRAVLTEGQPIVAALTLEQRGSIDLGESRARWQAFTSRQRVVTRRPGFVWDALVTLAPGVPVHVHDAYVAGEGLLDPALLGLFSLGRLHGDSVEAGGIAQGELMRFLAEAVWYPTALLPSQGVRWEPVDERTARATLTDGALTITLSFEFAEDGTLARVHAPARGRTVAGKLVPTPWEGRWSDVQTRGGMRVPLTGEVAWLTPQGRKPYWRGTVLALEVELAPDR